MASSELFAGVDIGGTKIAVALGAASGEVHAAGSIPLIDSTNPATPTPHPPGSPEEVLRRTANLIESLSAPLKAPLTAIGVGLPGRVNGITGTAEFLPNLLGKWKGAPVVDLLHRYTGKPVYILNDARLATLGEFAFGAGRQTRNMLLVTVGTGIGGGLILDGQLRLGLYGAAGEVGHQTIQLDGPECSCGSRGCLETMASGPALAAEGAKLVRERLAPRLQELAGDAPITPKLMVAAAAAGDALVAAAIDRTARYLGIGIANAVTITAVELVVITGGMSALGELLLQPVRQVIAERVRMFPGHEVRVACSTLGDQAGVLGGIALAAREALADNRPSDNS